jgi:hypothetical protein
MKQLIDCMHEDAMCLRDVELPTGEVVFFKSLIEAYPGVAAVHATRGAARGEQSSLVVATTAELEAELDGLLSDLAHEIDGLVWKISSHARVEHPTA